MKILVLKDDQAVTILNDLNNGLHFNLTEEVEKQLEKQETQESVLLHPKQWDLLVLDLMSEPRYSDGSDSVRGEIVLSLNEQTGKFKEEYPWGRQDKTDGQDTDLPI